MKRILFYLLFLCPALLVAQTEKYATADGKKVYRFRVELTDKDHSPFSIKRPQEFLSQKSIDRRKRLGFKVDEHDLPVSPQYLDRLRKEGMRIHSVSKWTNTAVVETGDSLKAIALANLPFVEGVRLVWLSPKAKEAKEITDRRSIITNKRDTLHNYYGKGYRQAQMIAADKLHEAGFKGDGMTIAVIDGGFYNADLIDGLSECRILGTRNFVRPAKSVYEENEHGMMVLACIAAHHPHSLVGTAPNASFYLLVSEDSESEQLVEEDNWCTALEYADSLGVDIVTSSLGYSGFDHKFMNYKYHELDGTTAIISRAASLAASRGILVFNSAGNSGDDSWKKISSPADATDILTVGAVNSLCENSTFSSIGNTADGRIKPDVMAQGVKSALYKTSGDTGAANGTSFATPILCGGVACLWQAFPEKKPTDIIRAVQLAGDNAEHPDNIFGYGVPDLWKAYELLKTQ